jgi:hypothetical protein
VKRGLVALAVLGACWLPPGVTSVESAKFPRTTDRMRRRSQPAGRHVLRMGEKAHAGPGPGQGKAVVRLVLTFRSGNSRCAADFYGAADGHSSPPPTGDSSPPPPPGIGSATWESD